MPAKRKTRTTSTKKKNYSTNKSRGFIDLYLHQRDEFFQNHPLCRALLGLLIVTFALAIAVLIYNKNIVFIGLSLDQEGIRYPYVEDSYVQKY